MLDFKKITLEDKEIIDDFLKNDNELSCENTFVNLLVWQNVYNYRYAIEDNLLFLVSSENGNEIYRLPFGEDICHGIELIEKHSTKPPVFWSPDGESFRKLPDSFKEKYDIHEERDAFDYLYLQSDLAELKGKKYHSKRNHISQFSKQFDWEYQTVTKENVSEILNCARQWYDESQEKIDKYALAEKSGISLMLENFETLGLKGGAIFVDGKAVAFTLGSPSNSYVFNIYVEKALPEFAGAYTVINKEFAARELCDYEYINREDDMGLEGLRKAKLSYKPIAMVKKFLFTPKEKI